MCLLDLSRTEFPTQCQRLFALQVEWPGPKAEHLSVSGVEIKNERSYTVSFPHAFVKSAESVVPLHFTFIVTHVWQYLWIYTCVSAQRNVNSFIGSFCRCMTS